MEGQKKAFVCVSHVLINLHCLLITIPPLFVGVVTVVTVVTANDINGLSW